MKMKKYKLGDLLDVTRGMSLSGEYYATEGKFMRLTLGNFDYRKNCFKDDKSKDNLYFTGNVKNEFILNKGDIITPLTEQAIGLLGSTAKIPCSGKYIQSQDVGLIKCNEKLFPDYAFYLISSKLVKDQLSAGAQQTKIRHTSPDKIKACTVWIPNYATQQKIAAVLSSLDAKIALNAKINARLERLAKRLYDYWFVQFDFPFDFAQGKPAVIECFDVAQQPPVEMTTTNIVDGGFDVAQPPHSKPYKSSGGKMVWNAELKREIPEGWEVKRLGDVIDLFDSKRIPLSSQQRMNKKGKFPYYGATGIMDYIDEYLFDDEYILLAEDGSVETKDGKVVIQMIWGKTWVNNHAHVIQSKNKKQFLFYSMHLSQINAKKIMSGSIQKKISQENMNKHFILVPKEEIINKFCEIILPFWKEFKVISEESQKLSSLRDKLLPLLMNGQVTVK